MNKKIITIITTCASICMISGGIISYAVTSDLNNKKDTTEINNNVSQEFVTKSFNSKNVIQDEADKLSAGRILKKAISSEKATKDDIYYMMLNSIDYYDKVSGKVCYPTSGDLSLVNYVEFQTSLSDTRAYSLYSQAYLNEDPINNDNTINFKSNNINENVYKQEYYCNDNSEVIINDLEKTYVTSQYNTVNLEDVCDIANEERITIEEDGEPCYNYKANPTNLPEVSVCLFPQEITFGFLTDNELWEINDVQNVDGRLAYHITGKTNEAYGKKLNVATFEFYVDVNTGVLLRYIGYDSNGLISDYMYTENIKFDKNASKIKVFDKAFINGYTSENAIESN